MLSRVCKPSLVSRTSPVCKPSRVCRAFQACQLCEAFQASSNPGHYDTQAVQKPELAWYRKPLVSALGWSLWTLPAGSCGAKGLEPLTPTLPGAGRGADQAR
ncbi:hypothetical protein MNVI_30330 [Mycobacterium noviomagense]|uniref:Uncharacterized protein n=1 Tax=Mycobacterium noviomagense TaxID=459858 RepID=A0A7I7PGP9_9MYCO|nr:hypothetical protein MNVI_30330 [Mycobacterium noviomagense]